MRPADLLFERHPQRGWSGRRPPLSCRTSPPQRGRSARPNAPHLNALALRHETLRHSCLVPGSSRLVLISPLVGEMSGRTEGGATPTRSSAFHP
ncbi:hypothetical protein ELH91_15975 [Rhizobium leguminosarum]|nr:hypothetical protein ELI40_16930 [Rhizobium leguminosarum]TAV90670.1 hypothetical protein ELI22_16185 [Rhizobium leguminosarum]TAV95275.1 hypothetical protein ELI21_16345 [Rhizobium leguminosarum]TAW36354.1 hypothetical protein ELI23_16385 [Rhizobium leguminosarum]TAX10981.1 hypothetical protein ELI07_16445 [Rhizobium leguminosarum]